MKARMLFILAGLLGMFGLALAQPPADPSAIFRSPYDPPAPAPKAGVPDFLKPSPIASPPKTADPRGGGPDGRYSLVPEDRPDVNADILVTPQLGPWMICVSTYTGQEAPTMARELAMEIRNAHRTAAYVFNHGAEERRKEYERVKSMVEKQREQLAKNNLPVDYPIRVRYMRIEEQCAVMIGGFPTEETARRGLDSIRKLPPPDPSKVKLDTKLYLTDVEKKKGEAAYVNPFQKAFICRNPAVKHQPDADASKWDMPVLRRLNAGEPFSLLECKKPMTLVVKQFQTNHVVQGRDTSSSLLDALGLGALKTGEHVDAAAHSAHNLAELFRKGKIESYVLHTKFASIVTVGAFDNLDDPNLRTMQNLVETRLKQQLEVVQLMPKTMPMMVPR